MLDHFEDNQDRYKTFEQVRREVERTMEQHVGQKLQIDSFAHNRGPRGRDDMNVDIFE